jgi:hypothetical protein
MTNEITHSARRINRLAEALGAKTYMEIGVEYGRTFFDVDIENKVAIDPDFRFDPKSVNTPGCAFFPMTSDAFFAHHDGSSFDIIFLDGLHESEQTLRDLLNCLPLCHPNTVIVIDDVMPTDCFSGLRDHADAIRFREMNGGQGPAWHGDVYKVVYFLHDFMPGLSYATIDDGWNRQTLVWRKPRQQFTPVFNNLETISRLTWFDLQNHIHVMQLTPEAVAIDRALSELAKVSDDGTFAVDADTCVTRTSLVQRAGNRLKRILTGQG